MSKVYPEGSIKSYEELIDAERNGEVCETFLYSASKFFKQVDKLDRILNVQLCQLMDNNIPENGYNDWFLFVDETKAKAYAEAEINSLAN